MPILGRPMPSAKSWEDSPTFARKHDYILCFTLKIVSKNPVFCALLRFSAPVCDFKLSAIYLLYASYNLISHFLQNLFSTRLLKIIFITFSISNYSTKNLILNRFCKAWVFDGRDLGTPNSNCAWGGSGSKISSNIFGHMYRINFIVNTLTP